MKVATCSKIMPATFNFGPRWRLYLNGRGHLDLSFDMVYYCGVWNEEVVSISLTPQIWDEVEEEECST